MTRRYDARITQLEHKAGSRQKSRVLSPEGAHVIAVECFGFEEPEGYVPRFTPEQREELMLRALRMGQEP
jgi:hypothetical protein